LSFFEYRDNLSYQEILRIRLQNHGAEFYWMQPYTPSCCSYFHKVINTTVFFGIEATSRDIARTFTKSCIDTTGGGLDSDCLTHKVSETTFRMSGHPGTRSQKSWSQVRIGPTAKLLITHKVINTTVFLSISPHVARYSPKNHASDTGGGWARLSDCCSTQKNSESTFHRIRAQVSITHKIMEPNYIRIGPAKLLLVLTKLSTTTVLGIGPPPRCCRTYHKMHPTPAADGPFQIVALTQE
jgi:hypothetical protein